MDAGEAAGEDHAGRCGSAAPSPRARATSPRRSSRRRPRTHAHARLAVVLGDVGERPGLAVELVLALAGRAGEGVDHAEEQVAADVLEVAAVASATCPPPRCGRWCTCPWPSSARAGRRSRCRPTPRTARAAAGGRSRVAPRPRPPSRRRAARGSRSRPGRSPCAGSTSPTGRIELHLDALVVRERVGQRVEVERARERVRDDRVGRRHEGERVARCRRCASGSCGCSC